MDIAKQNKLALELADSLDDMESLQVYRGFTQQYTEEFLKKILTKVLSVPEDKIRKTRGALFTYLVKQNAQHPKYRSRD